MSLLCILSHICKRTLQMLTNIFLRCGMGLDDMVPSLFWKDRKLSKEGLILYGGMINSNMIDLLFKYSWKIPPYGLKKKVYCALRVPTVAKCPPVAGRTGTDKASFLRLTATAMLTGIGQTAVNGWRCKKKKRKMVRFRLHHTALKSILASYERWK